jgi:hypothetical protein
MAESDRASVFAGGVEKYDDEEFINAGIEVLK